MLPTHLPPPPAEVQQVEGPLGDKCANEGEVCTCTGNVYYGTRFVCPNKCSSGPEYTFEHLLTLQFTEVQVTTYHAYTMVSAASYAGGSVTCSGAGLGIAFECALPRPPAPHPQCPWPALRRPVRACAAVAVRRETTIRPAGANARRCPSSSARVRPAAASSTPTRALGPTPRATPPWCRANPCSARQNRGPQVQQTRASG